LKYGQRGVAFIDLPGFTQLIAASESNATAREEGSS
jgi:hypothetical protein